MHLEVIFGHLGRHGLKSGNQSFQPVGVARHQHRVFGCDPTRSSTPCSAASALSVERLQLQESSNTALPCATLPSASLSDSSHTACQEPTSDQPQATGTTAACAVFSITA